MKYIEEIVPGDLFEINGQKYVLSADYRKTKNSIKKMAISIDSGMSNWFDSNTIVNIVDLYFRDKEGHILLLKEHKDEHGIYKENKNIH